MSPLSTFGSHSSSAANSACTSCRIVTSRMSLSLPVTPDSPKASSCSGSLAATDSWRLQSQPFLCVRTHLCLWLAFNADAVIDRLDIGDRPGCRDREVMVAAGVNRTRQHHRARAGRVHRQIGNIRYGDARDLGSDRLLDCLTIRAGPVPARKLIHDPEDPWHPIGQDIAQPLRHPAAGCAISRQNYVARLAEFLVELVGGKHPGDNVAVQHLGLHLPPV